MCSVPKRDTELDLFDRQDILIDYVPETEYSMILAKLDLLDLGWN